jgi:hypothetical protein
VHKAGAEYLALSIFGGVAQLRRFARDVMPAFAGKAGRSVGAVVTSDA